VPCATSKGIPSKRYKLSPNIIAQIPSIYKVLLSLFRDISAFFRIQIPSCAVLPTSLLSKETQKVTRQFHCRKAKTGAGAASMTVPTPVSAVFACMEGYFAPEGMKKPLLSW
jgi:hypothetical protein